MRMRQKPIKVQKLKQMKMKLQVKDLMVNEKKKGLKKINKKARKLRLINGDHFIMICSTEQEISLFSVYVKMLIN